MARNSRKKAAAAGLVLALMALVLDRTVFKGSPLSAQVASAAATPMGPSSTESRAKESPRATTPSAVVAAHLRTVRDRVLVPPPFDPQSGVAPPAAPPADAFDPTRLFKSLPVTTADSAPAAGGDRFQQEHKLTSVLIACTGSRAVATIDQKPMTIGEKLGQSRLLSIDKLSAAFDVDGEKTVLIMELPTKEQFAQQHKLNAVLFPSGQDASNGVVVIEGGRHVRIGDLLDGYTLRAIDAGSRQEAPSAVFEAEGKRVTLSVPQAR